jgi:hypothetical protein
MRVQFNARYVRVYAWCDSVEGFMDTVISAAYQVGIGVYSVIWFGYVIQLLWFFNATNQHKRYDGDDSWKGRRDSLLNTIDVDPYVLQRIL